MISIIVVEKGPNIRSEGSVRKEKERN